MRIIAQCPKCGTTWLLDKSAADRRIRCRNCARLFKVPRLEELSKAVKTIEKAKGPIFVDEEGKAYG